MVYYISMGIGSRIVSRLGEDASHKLSAFVEVSEIMREEVGIRLTHMDKKTELGKIITWSNNLQSKVAYSCGTMWSEIGRSALQQTSDVEAVSGRGRCRCGTSKALKWSWHGGVHPSFFWGCKAYTGFDQARHDKAIGLRDQSFEAVVTTPQFSCHLLPSDMSAMVIHLDEAKCHYANELATSEEDISRARQVFGKNFPEDVEARRDFFISLKDKTVDLLSQRSSTPHEQLDTACNTED